MKIVLVPNRVLTSASLPIESIMPKFQKLIVDMIDTLNKQKNPEGVGLAAPQVGVSARLFIIKPGKKSAITVCINPKYVQDPKTNIAPIEAKKTAKKKKEEHSRLEGCLSIPKIWGSVDRQETVELVYLNAQGKQIQKTFAGFEATIVQHEMDHLDGILFTARVLEQKNSLYKEVDGELEKFSI